MKHSRSTRRDPTDIEPAADPYADEAMAMVYVGDVYSLVVQKTSPSEAKAEPVHSSTSKPAKQDDNDALWPLIR